MLEVARRQEDLQVGADQPGLRGKLAAIHAGHDHVGEQHIDALVASQYLERFRAARDRDHLAVQVFEHVLGRHSDQVVVVDP